MLELLRRKLSSRSCWYLSSWPVPTSTPIVSSAIAVITRMCLAWAPATRSTPMAMAIITDAVPRSGWASVSADRHERRAAGRPRSG